MTDWFRRKAWTKMDEEEFFIKLGRARKDSRPQYLKIQAIELVSTKNKDLLKVAESLLNKLLTEYPSILLERQPNLLFPIDKYKVNSILSIINKFNGKEEKATLYAELAEQNANKETSGLRYHKNLGVVTDRENWLDKLVQNK